MPDKLTNRIIQYINFVMNECLQNEGHMAQVVLIQVPGTRQVKIGVSLLQTRIKLKNKVTSQTTGQTAHAQDSPHVVSIKV